MKLSGDKFFGWPSPVLEGITRAEDLFKFAPLGANHPYIRGQIDRTKRVVDALNGDCVSIYLVFVPLSCIRLAIGYPMMMKLIRENPEAMKYACSVVAEDLKLLVKGIVQEAGADGIIATLPLYAVYRIHQLSDEQLCRATMLSYLVCTYIKEYSGRLSAFCGCGIAAGTGMAVALCHLKGGDLPAMVRALNNMAASITGMICDGGNQGCVMKGVAACSTAFDSVDFALAGAAVASIHGINGRSPEETMRNMGLIASPGMEKTEEVIVEIQRRKADAAR